MYRLSKGLKTGLRLSLEVFQHARENLHYVASQGAKPYSRLVLGGDNAGWVLDWEMKEVSKIAQHLGIRLAKVRWQNSWVPLSVFFADQYFLLKPDWLNTRHRIGFAYFHGLPGTGEPVFDQVYENLCKHHTRIHRIQVSHTQMKTTVLRTGIDPSKVFQIPIGINLDFFPFRDNDRKNLARETLGIPQSAFVIGSFQKDGVGWDAGMEPKLIKGPDVFLATVRQLKSHIPELCVLLSGPARGYVKAGLEAMDVPYYHTYLDDYSAIGGMYHALDLYLVTSRQEGGPKAILESMASGIPIVSTRVGQAVDLIQHGQNGWLAEVEDVESLAHWILQIYNLNDESLMPVLSSARAAAEMNSYNAQIPLWAKFMEGFVL